LRIRSRVKEDFDFRDALRSAPLYLLIIFGLSLLSYAALFKFFRLPSSLPLVLAGGNSPGVRLGDDTLGFASVALLLVLAALTAASYKRYSSTITFQKLGVALIIGILLGGGFGLVPPSSSSVWLHSEQASGDGFTMVVYYNSTVLNIGNNLSMLYTLRDVSFQQALQYNLLFGGQFSMVFFNQTGGQTVAFRAPISFALPSAGQTVQLQPGDVWKSTLGWNGTIFREGTRTVASPGNYTLASYGVLEDANISLYVDLHPANLTVTLKDG
jgi:hypothetical protein